MGGQMGLCNVTVPLTPHDLKVWNEVPQNLRRTAPILCSGEHPVWVCGYRIDERFKFTAATRRVVIVKIQPS
jgi:hypothetical protein